MKAPVEGVTDPIGGGAVRISDQIGGETGGTCKIVRAGDIVIGPDQVPIGILDDELVGVAVGQPHFGRRTASRIENNRVAVWRTARRGCVGACRRGCSGSIGVDEAARKNGPAVVEKLRARAVDAGHIDCHGKPPHADTCEILRMAAGIAGTAPPAAVALMLTATLSAVHHAST